MYCEKCGAQLNQNQNFCSRCGHSKTNGGVNQPTQNQNSYRQNSESIHNIGSKSKICAGLLGILVGTFGVHNFYLGYTGKGAAQVLITVLSCGFLCWVSSIWALIEGIMILTGASPYDAQGNLLRD